MFLKQFIVIPTLKLKALPIQALHSRWVPSGQPAPPYLGHVAAREDAIGVEFMVEPVW
jgi:hypothetical protein